MLSDDSLERVFVEKRQEEIALRNEANRSRERAIKRARKQVVIAAMMGETRLYRESE
jgi:hypothetical protein